MRYLLPFVILLASLISSCTSRTEAEKIVDKSIEAHGGTFFEKAKIKFDFRDRHYNIFKSPSAFEYVREFTDSTGVVRDVLNNSGFVRTVNGQQVTLEEKQSKAFTNSVNSVAYFAFLPYGLNDASVFKEYLGESELEGKSHQKIKVTFSKEGGGEDFDDEFIYWFDKETFRIGYVAYSYHTDGGGVRFRRAIKTHEVGGLVFLDYENYKPEVKDTPVEEMETLFKEGKLALLSEILLENIQVELIK